MSDKAVKGDAFYMNANKDKSANNHPDLKGRMLMTVAELQALIAIYKRAQENNEEPVLQIDFAGWLRQSKNDGKPYVYCAPEIYTGPRKKKMSSPSSFSGF